MTATSNPAALLESKDLGGDTLRDLRAAAYASEDNWRELREAATAAAGAAKLSLERRVKAAYGLYLLGKVGVAIEELVEAKADSDPVGAWVLGLCYLADSEPAKALAAFEAGLKKAKADLPLQLGAIEAKRLLGRGDEALQEARALQKKQAKNADVLYHVGAALEAQGEYGEAMDIYEEALEIDEDHAGALFRLAFTHEQRGGIKVALQYYKRLADVTPTYQNGLLNYGLLLEDLGKYAEAAEVYRRVLHRHPENDRARMFLKDAESSVDMYYDEDLERRSSRRNAILRIPVTDFELSVRARNCLNKMNIRNLGDLVTKTEEELLSYKNFGETSLHEIKQMLAQKGLRLGMYREGDEGPELAAEGEEGPDGDEEVMRKPISELDLSVRARNCMERLNLRTIGELVQKSEAELLAVKNFGQTSLTELKQKLSEQGLVLRG